MIINLFLVGAEGSWGEGVVSALKIKVYESREICCWDGTRDCSSCFEFQGFRFWD